MKSMFAVKIFCIFLVNFATRPEVMFATACTPANAPEIVFSVNAGSNEGAIDSTGLVYGKDTTTGKLTAACTHPMIGVPLFDEAMYRTVSYSHTNMGYKFTLTGDGYYRIILKFLECWHSHPGQRISKVLLNRREVLVFDVAQRVGIRRPLTENVLFSVCNGRMYYNDEEVTLGLDQTVSLDLESIVDGPMLSAMAVLKHQRPDEYLPESLMPTKKFFGGQNKFYCCKPKIQPKPVSIKGPASLQDFIGKKVRVKNVFFNEYLYTGESVEKDSYRVFTDLSKNNVGEQYYWTITQYDSYTEGFGLMNIMNKWLYTPAGNGLLRDAKRRNVVVLSPQEISNYNGEWVFEAVPNSETSFYIKSKIRGEYLYPLNGDLQDGNGRQILTWVPKLTESDPQMKWVIELVE